MLPCYVHIVEVDIKTIPNFIWNFNEFRFMIHRKIERRKQSERKRMSRR